MAPRQPGQNRAYFQIVFISILSEVDADWIVFEKNGCRLLEEDSDRMVAGLHAEELRVGRRDIKRPGQWVDRLTRFRSGPASQKPCNETVKPAYPYLLVAGTRPALK